MERYRLVACVFLFSVLGIGMGCGSPALDSGLTERAASVRAPVPSGPFEAVYRRLAARGADSEFIRALAEDPGIVLDPEIVRLNVLNFAIPARYENFLNAKSLNQCRIFLRKNRQALSACEARFGVPKEVVASLLWVETKHG